MAFSAILSAGGSTAHSTAAQTISDATGISPPTGADLAEGYVRTAALVYSNGGVTPTATLGTQLNVGDVVRLRSREEIASALFIRQGGSDGAVDWSFFSGQM